MSILRTSILLKASVAAVLVAGMAPQVASAKPLRHRAAHATTYAHRHVYAPRYATRGAPAYRSADPYGGYLPTGPYGPNAVNYPAPSAADDPYNPYAPPGAAVRAMARRNQFAPGVTNELAPDNIATASGGPSGGVPGFSSH